MAKDCDEILIFHELPEIEAVTAVTAVNICNNFSRHVHSGYTFVFIDSGSRKVRRASGERLYGKGEFLILNPGASHSCESLSDETPGPHSYRALCVNQHLLRQLSEQISDKTEPLPIFHETAVSDVLLAELFESFFSLMNIAGATLEKQAVLNDFLSLAVLNHSETPPSQSLTGPLTEPLERARDHISSFFRDNISLKDLSGLACISPFHLQRLFVRRFGLSPQEYLVECRIKEALRLLKLQVPLAEAAFSAGFADQSHFSRHFRKIVGLSPGKFAALNTTTD